MRAVNVYEFGGAHSAACKGVKVLMRGWSVLGNPRPLKDESERTEVIEFYRRWLWDRIRSGDEAILFALRNLKEGDLLGCVCSPKVCHVDVVIRAARWLAVRPAPQ